MIDPELVKILCCPLGKAELNYENDSLVCTKCKAVFPIRDGIPVLLIEEALMPEGVMSISELKCQIVQNDNK